MIRIRLIPMTREPAGLTYHTVSEPGHDGVIKRRAWQAIVEQRLRNGPWEPVDVVTGSDDT